MKKLVAQRELTRYKNRLSRKHRGPMNVKRLRNLKFLKDEVKVAGYKLKGRFSMKGREPGVETEM